MDTNCQFPNNTYLTSYYYGCRCKRCCIETNKYRKTKDCAKLLRESNRRLKIQTLKAYGGTICSCCNENNILFLSLDHIFNDGAAHRKTINGKGTEVYRYLRKNNYPDKDRYQVLCMNCNFGKKLNKGTCPHKGIL